MEILAVVAIVISLSTVILGYFALRQTVNKGVLDEFKSNDLHSLVNTLKDMKKMCGENAGKLDQRMTRLGDRIDKRLGELENLQREHIVEWHKK